jgi:polyphenol oxidase
VTVSQPSSHVRWRVTERPESWHRDHLLGVDAVSADPRIGRFTWLDQVHGADVVTVETPGAHRGATADAAITACPGAVLVIRTADCVPVLFEARIADVTGATRPVLGVAHAGWKGLLGGVIEATVDALRRMGADDVVGWVGPHIGVECYEFGVADLAVVESRFGRGVVGVTSSGMPGLDLSNAIATAFTESDVVNGGRLIGSTCTACDARRWFSHRARRDEGRLALIAEVRR